MTLFVALRFVLALNSILPFYSTLEKWSSLASFSYSQSQGFLIQSFLPLPYTVFCISFHNYVFSVVSPKFPSNSSDFNLLFLVLITSCIYSTINLFYFLSTFLSKVLSIILCSAFLIMLLLNFNHSSKLSLKLISLITQSLNSFLNWFSFNFDHLLFFVFHKLYDL